MGGNSSKQTMTPEEKYKSIWNKIEGIDQDFMKRVMVKVVCQKVKLGDIEYTYIGTIDHNGVPHGRGAYYIDKDTTNLQFVSYVQHGTLHGRCRKYTHGVLIYDGYVENNVLHGEGICYHDNGIIKYHGEFRNNSAHGKGKVYRKNGVLYIEGLFEKNKFIEGIYYDTKCIYEGKFENNYLTGPGQTRFPDGKIFDGIFEKDVLIKLTKFKHNDYSVDLILGNTYKVCIDGNTYTGEIKVNYPTSVIIQGYGKIVYKNSTIVHGDMYEGFFENGKKHGLGYKTVGDVTYKQHWMNGILMSDEHTTSSYSVEYTPSSCSEGHTIKQDSLYVPVETPLTI